MQRIVTALGLLLLFSSVSLSQQLVADLSVDVTEEDGLYTYQYTINNAATSEVPVSFFNFTTGSGATAESISGPENWFASFDPSQPNFQALFIAGDGLSCEVPDFDIQPNESAEFTIVSSWGPEPQDFIYSKLTDDCLGLVGNPIDGTVLAPSIPPVPEPHSASLLILGVVGMCTFRRVRRA